VDPDYQVAHRNQIPLLLLNIIIRVHTNEGLNVTGAIVNARKVYSSVRQYSYGSVADFKRRFGLSLQVSQSAGNERPEEAIITAEFIDKLDRGRFADLQDELRNKSLQAAEDEVALLFTSNYKPS